MLFSDTKEILLNGTKHIKAYLGRTKIWEAIRKVLTTITGYPITLTNSTGDDLVNYKIYGNRVQNGTPTPDNPIEIQSVGEKTANLYAGQSEYTLTKVTNDTHISFYEAFEIGKTYTLFCYIDNTQGTATSGFRMSVGKTGGWNYLSSNRIGVGSKGYSRVIITIPDDYNRQLNIQYQVNGGTSIFKDIMLVEGSYTLDNLPQYEPYGYKIPVKVNNITTNIYLNEPLRKIGNYADYIDYENNQIVRNIIKKALNVNLITYGNRANVYGFRMNGFALGGKLDGTYNMLNICDSFKTISGGSVASSNTESLALRQGSLYLFLDKSRISSFDATEASQYVNSLGAYVYYILDEPEYETIELPIIPTNEGTNIIEVDTTIAPSNMEVEYYKKNA